jgi:hypothetical protein
MRHLLEERFVTDEENERSRLGASFQLCLASVFADDSSSEYLLQENATLFTWLF